MAERSARCGLVLAGWLWAASGYNALILPVAVMALNCGVHITSLYTNLHLHLVVDDHFLPANGARDK